MDLLQPAWIISIRAGLSSQEVFHYFHQEFIRLESTRIEDPGNRKWILRFRSKFDGLRGIKIKNRFEVLKHF